LRTQSFDRGQFCPSACTASIRHERTALPSRRTVHAPHTPCSQPTCVPPSPSSRAGNPPALYAARPEPRGHPIHVTRICRFLISMSHSDSVTPLPSQARLAASARVRRVSTSARCRRYSPEAWMSDSGSSIASLAFFPACSNTGRSASRRRAPARPRWRGWGSGDTEENDPSPGTLTGAVHRRGRNDARHGEVTMPARDFLHCPAGLRR